MRTRLGIRIHGLLEKRFPERRVFLKSDDDTRFVRLSSEVQLAVAAGVTLFVGWSFVATSVVLMDSIGAGNYREQAKRDQSNYLARLNSISEERDARASEALAAQDRFNAALKQISAMQSELLASETRRRELETGIEVIQTTLRKTMAQREAARASLKELRENTLEDSAAQLAAITAPAQMDFVTQALEDTARERDQIEADAQHALDEMDALHAEIHDMEQRNEQIFRQLEQAMEVSVEPLQKMFSAAGLKTNRILDEVRRGYNGQGGPLEPLAISTSGEAASADQVRANDLLAQMSQLNLYRLAAERAPFATPVHLNQVRQTSGFGYRRDPKTGGRRLHKGSDFAGSTGTDIFATADGVVKTAGWQSGYGRVVIIQHAFGIETRYAHNSKLRVQVGQRVSRGDHIADMGNTGRSTGTHLHYEVRVNGTPVNPMIYIKAARNVF
ncbi:M23 family metallopeptidase [Epibacterium ulvae]|uniref:Murein DD-endopeptidase MepM and murein hydrolase activator NlpD, contain LysM domain n=1 Tax=Epibacterium ulvae TaxID=1156985 RepID=A0A1G5RD69_9RHOB|nr:M23 family metallopeptidase [Epibacterium ulvae]SCZ71720.1 Murein DD-endopeptidase MepM and murein hydrolase activator NlpD, contain LysM domain [Epibacterium ulvae]